MVSMLVDSEWDDRNNRRIERQMRNARFRYKANVEQLHFDIDRNLDKNQLMRLAECTFIQRKENLLDHRQHRYRQELHCICHREPGLHTRVQSSLRQHNQAVFKAENGQG